MTALCYHCITQSPSTPHARHLTPGYTATPEPLHGCHRSFLLQPATPTARCSECNLLSQHSAIVPTSSSSPSTHSTPARSPPGTTCRTCHHPSPQSPAPTTPSEQTPQQRQARYTHTPATLHSFLLPGGKPKKTIHPNQNRYTHHRPILRLPTHPSTPTTARARTHQPHREQCSLIRGASRVFVCGRFLVDDLGSRQPVAGCCL